MVRVEGLEPPRLAALDPKSSVSTNFTTPAAQIFAFLKGFPIRRHKDIIFFIKTTPVLLKK